VQQRRIHFGQRILWLVHGRILAESAGGFKRPPGRPAALSG